MLLKIKKYIEYNLKNISVLFFFILVGLVIGILLYHFLEVGTKNELVTSLKSTLDISKSEGFESINVIKNGMIANIIMVLFIYLTSITLISNILMCSINIAKGFAIGIYIPTIFEVFGIGNGIIVTILLVILPNLIYFPSFIYLCINSLDINSGIINKDYNGGSKISFCIKHIYRFILGFSVMFLCVIIEQFLSLVVIGMYN